MRGYKEFHIYKLEIRQFRLINNFKYFSNIREKLLHDVQIIIRTHWLAYKWRKEKRIAKDRGYQEITPKMETKKPKPSKKHFRTAKKDASMKKKKTPPKVEIKSNRKQSVKEGKLLIKNFYESLLFEANIYL